MRIRGTVVAAVLALAVGTLGPEHAGAATPSGDDSASWRGRVVASGLANPFEITVGPDGWIWTTERTSGRVYRIRPAQIRAGRCCE